MRRILHATLLTSAVVAGALAFAPLPLCAQMGQMGDTDSAISFNSFQDQLAPFGYWLYSDRWGVVWQPADVPNDFQPYYTAGHWVYTDDYGWYWASEYPWGDIPFHYGRWVNDPDDGWMWIPGYVWSPGWVAWRTGGAYIGWTPLPPDDAFIEGRSDIGVSFGQFNIAGLYARWYGPAFNESRFARNWVFVGMGDIARPDYRSVVIRDPARVIDIIHQTRNVTNYTVVNNFVVNRSVDIHVVERAAGHPIAVVRAATVIRHPNLVASVVVGQRVQLRMRDIAPRGRGIANSAPPPPPRVVARLSTNVTPRNGHAPVHLFTKATVAAPEAQSRFHGAPVRGPAAGREGAISGPNAGRNGEAPANGMTGPNGEHPHQPGGAMRPNGEEQPNGMNGPNGEPPHKHQPGGAMGPNGEEQPGGSMNGPNGEPPHHHQPGGAMGPNGEEQPGGSMNGPNGEPPHHHQPGGAMGPNGEEQPSGTNGPSGEPPHHHQPSGAMAPSGEEQPSGMNGANGEPPHPHQPSGAMGPSGEEQPSGANGPNGEPPHHHQPSGAMAPSGEEQPSGMNGANGEPPHHHQPSGAMGPNSSPKPNATPPENAKPQTAPPQGSAAPEANGTPPPHKKKNPPESPPQNPPQ